MDLLEVQSRMRRVLPEEPIGLTGLTLYVRGELREELVARLDLGGTSRRKARLTIHVSAVETADVLDRDLAAVDSNQRMLA